MLVKQASDLNVSVINQMVMQRLAETQHEALIAAAIKSYRAKRDAMLAALAAHMPKSVRWTKPQGGLFVWATLPEGVSGAELLERAVREVKVAFVPGGAFFHDGSGANTIRLSLLAAGAGGDYGRRSTPGVAVLERFSNRRNQDRHCDWSAATASNPR